MLAKSHMRLQVASLAIIAVLCATPLLQESAVSASSENSSLYVRAVDSSSQFEATAGMDQYRTPPLSAQPGNLESSSSPTPSANPSSIAAPDTEESDQPVESAPPALEVTEGEDVPPDSESSANSPTESSPSDTLPTEPERVEHDPDEPNTPSTADPMPTVEPQPEGNSSPAPTVTPAPSSSPTTAPTTAPAPVPTESASNDPKTLDPKAKLKGKFPVCHRSGTGYHLLNLPYSALVAHGAHHIDIVPPIPGHYAGNRWNAEGKAIFNRYCS